MKRFVVHTVLLVACTFPAHAVTVSNGVVQFNQADALAGNVTPGDTPGFPVTITAFGSYRLSSNLSVPAGAIGIYVAASEVTIEFSGFRMAGGGTALRGIEGISRGLTVRGGTIRAFTQHGIKSIGKYLRVEDMVIAENGYEGIKEDPSLSAYARITGNTLVANYSGVYCGKFCHIESNNIADNGSFGIVLSGEGSGVYGNTISSNGTYGVHAFYPFGFGDNTIIGHQLNPGSPQIDGTDLPMQPNACYPTAC